MAGMVLSTLYGLRFFDVLPGLDIPWMRALHGTGNALGFALPALMAWTMLLSRGKRTTSRGKRSTS